MAKKRILLADPSPEFLALLLKEKSANAYEIEIATTGSLCLEKLNNWAPDLVVYDLFLPELHGLEFLKTVKQKEKPTGFILTSFHLLLQHYKSALEFGADYVLNKPFPPAVLFFLISRFFQGDLKPDPFPNSLESRPPSHTPALPAPASPSYIKFWGTRGSNPVSGSEYLRFGGNTPCLEIRHGKDLLIIDAGSGIRELGQVLSTQKQEEINILFSHTHLDHLTGFPFFYPLYQSHQKVRAWTPLGFEKTAEEVFSELFNYAYFPVSFEDLHSHLSFSPMRDGQELSFGSIKVWTHYAFHPGATLCFKLQIGDKKIGYVTDNEFLQGCHLTLDKIAAKPELFLPYEAQIRFFSDCDILIHEAQYTAEEYRTRVGWGHTSVFNAAFLIQKAGIRHWIITHHDPRHTDEFLLKKQQLHIQTLEEIHHPCTVQLAYDGMVLSL